MSEKDVKKVTEETESKNTSQKGTEPKKEQPKSVRNRNIIIWVLVAVILAGIAGFYYYSTTKEGDPTPAETEETTGGTYDGLLEMDYEVVDVTETQERTSITVKGAFRDADIVSFQNKLINMVETPYLDVYYFEDTATNYEFEGVDTADFIAYTNTDFDTLTMDLHSYESLPDIQTPAQLNKFNTGTVETDEEGVLTVSCEMDLDTSDMTSIAENAKGFAELFKHTNSDKEIDQMKVVLIADDTNSYVYDTAHTDAIELVETKTFTEK